ncbi:hypothetical protein KBB96_07620 [Luteolibacter ambystomatis]|uniref:Transposase n=1 Tax=Luteolibacter ambystomatis TaxID=2824561 RepID=A0A975PGX6_9BACT|nr:hypothetical protein [Luteolibacter ambystomatis]QUE52752.1 hypothetical protein KBB96_07620 [Luteolibacter ambystomatis]
MAAKRTRKIFSAKEKSKIVAFVLSHNKKHGKGGQAAAAAKFGLSDAAVSYWMAGYKIAKGGEGWMEVVGAGRDKRARRLAELAVVEAEVSDLRRKLAAAEAKLHRLKKAAI